MLSKNYQPFNQNKIMNNLYNYTSRTGYVLPKQAHFLWRYVILVFTLFLFSGTAIGNGPV